MKRMLRYKNNKGFTLAEVMMAVAIIVILSGLSFIGVANYTRSMALLERDSIAKEIFIAAQNHLTMAKGQGYLGKTKYGTKVTSDDAYYNGAYYFTVSSDSPIESGSILDAMLPFGSIDETVRAGSYVIGYSKDTGIVKDVFYCPESGRYSGKITQDYKTLRDAYGATDKKNARRTGSQIIGWFGGEEAASLVSEDSLDEPVLNLVNGDVLYAEIKKNTKDGDDYKLSSSGTVKLQLVVEGMVSGAKEVFNISENGAIVLDDITVSGRHFSQIANFTEKESIKGLFIPGEDIKVYAEVSDSSKLIPVKRSAVKTTNSLFGDVIEVEEGTTTKSSYTKISISSLRHLENLYDSKSKMFYVVGTSGSSSSAGTDGATGTGVSTVTSFSPQAIVAGSTKIMVEQTKDMNWGKDTTDEGGFLKNVTTVHTNIPVTTDTAIAVRYEGSATKTNCFLPIGDTSYTLLYDGCGFSISNVKVDVDGENNAGLIETLKVGSISNLELIDFNVQAKNGPAGALIGGIEASGIEGASPVTITNVLARCSAANGSTADGTSLIVSDKNAGGLVGSLAGGTCILKGCAASVIVSGKENAGGLIGVIPQGTVTLSGCYSGGHTVDGQYSTDFNVKAVSTTGTTTTESGNSGGLVGCASDAKLTMENCYSTCSAQGLTAGGLIGKAVGIAANKSQITNCYATGLVSTKKDSTTGKDTGKRGALVGESSTSCEYSNCKYFESVNEITETKTSGSTTTEVFKGYLRAVGSDPVDENGDVVEGSKTGGITPFDDSLANYQAFVGKNSDDWALAVPYDDVLKAYYTKTETVGGTTKTIIQYHMKSVESLGFSVPTSSTEDGYFADGYFVETHYGDWPSPEIEVVNTASK